jgi:hypothetical protein
MCSPRTCLWIYIDQGAPSSKKNKLIYHEFYLVLKGRLIIDLRGPALKNIFKIKNPNEALIKIHLIKSPNEALIKIHLTKNPN